MKKDLSFAETLKASYSLLTIKEKKKLLFFTVISFISSALDVISVFSVYPLISILFDPTLIETNKKYSSLLNLLGTPKTEIFILILCVGSLIIISSASLLNIWVQINANKFCAKCQERFGTDLISQMIFSNFEWHILQNTTTLMTLFLNHSTIWSRNVIRQAPVIAGNISTIIIPVFSLIILTPKYSLPLLLFASFVIFYFLKSIKRKTNKLMRVNKIKSEELNILLTEILQGIKEVKLSGKESLFIKKFNQMYHICCMNLASVNNWNQIPTSAVLFIGQVSMISIGTYLYIVGTPTNQLIGLMSVVALVASKLVPSINKLGAALTSLSNVNSWVNTLNDIYLSLEKVIYKSSSKDEDYSRWSELVFKSVFYRYPNREEYALKDINLKLKKGFHYGFVGCSGAGKSTIIDLINGLLIPKRGGIYVDTQPVHEYGIRRWQKKIGYVPQESRILDLSFKENVAFGIQPFNIDEEKIMNCVSIVGLESFVKKLPNGIDSKMGDRGKTLSGGQKQRIAIARALYSEPEILILDEATSSLDSISEQAIKKALKKLTGKVTVLSIAHRFATIIDADHIFLFEKGSLKDQGNFKYLYEKSLLFRDLAKNLQKN